MTTESTFWAVRVRCRAGHEELNTLDAYTAARGERGNVGLICARCGGSLAMVAKAEIPLRASNQAWLPEAQR
jgi:hypothetical protein